MADVIFSHGDKGGAGKSTTAASLIDYCLANNKPVALIEGDRRTPDVGTRFYQYVPFDDVDLNKSGDKEEAAVELLNSVERLSADDADITIVVNLPANSSETLDEVGDVIVVTLTEAGHSCHVMYALGDQKPATEGLKQSVKSGLLSMLSGDAITIVYNKHLGDGNPNHWDYVMSGARKKMGKAFKEIEIPALKPPQLARKVFVELWQTPFFELVKRDNHGLTLGETVLFQRKWVYPMHENIAKVLPHKGGAGDE